MRILLLSYSLITFGLPVFGQGIVNFANTPSTLISYASYGNGPLSVGLISGSGKWYFGLLTSPTGGAGSFSFAGVYATNNATAPGRFVNNGVTVPNWTVGAPLFYMVAAWHSLLGPTFMPAWLVAAPPGPFTISAVGFGVAGGTDSQGRPFPPLPLFGGTGITSGFEFCCLPELRISPNLHPPAGMPFEFQVFGLQDLSIVIEASTNLAPQSWIALQTGTLTNPGVGTHFSDPQWTNYPNRFYRVRSP